MERSRVEVPQIDEFVGNKSPIIDDYNFFMSIEELIETLNCKGRGIDLREEGGERSRVFRPPLSRRFF